MVTRRNSRMTTVQAVPFSPIAQVLGHPHSPPEKKKDVFPEKKKINKKKMNYFPSSDPHHDIYIYTVCYWQIFWHSI